MSTGKIVQLDPATLTIALNVRSDVKLDKEFVASIKELGILQPPMVVANDSGGHDVVLGQRRVLAAVEAGLKTIPAYVVEKSEADAARVIDQLTENEQRQHLTASELVGGYKQLALFGLSPAQIAKKVSRPRKQVEVALSVADDDVALKSLDEAGLTLDQAAVLVDFAGDKTARKKLVEAAADGRFEHVAAEMKSRRELENHIATLKAELEQEGVTVLPDANSQWDPAALEGHGLSRVVDLGNPPDFREPLEISNVDKTVLAGRVAKDWMEDDSNRFRSWAKKQYFIIDALASGFAPRQWGKSDEDLTPEEVERRRQRAEEKEAARVKQEALNIAEQVRTEWIKEFLQRKTLPTDVLDFVAQTAFDPGLEGQSSVLELLGTQLPEPVDLAEIGGALTKEITRNGGTKVLTAIALATCEYDMTMPWRGNSLAARYLPQLAAWGYGLSEAEQNLIDEKTQGDD